MEVESSSKRCKKKSGSRDNREKHIEDKSDREEVRKHKSSRSKGSQDVDLEEGEPRSKRHRKERHERGDRKPDHNEDDIGKSRPEERRRCRREKRQERGNKDKGERGRNRKEQSSPGQTKDDNENHPYDDERSPDAEGGGSYWNSLPEKPDFKNSSSKRRRDAAYDDGDSDGHQTPESRYWGDGSTSKIKMKDSDGSGYLVGKPYYNDTKTLPRKRAELKDGNDVEKPREAVEAPKRKTMDTLMTRTGGAYIPPGKLRMMQASITDKSSAEYQRIAWEALKKSIHGHINKVNTSNIGIVARLLFKENIVRGRGLLCRSIIQAQAASPTFTNVYASLVAIVNSKFPNIGELLLKRVVIRFKRAYKRSDKAVCLTAATFIAHLINQRVAHEILGLELLTLLVESPTDDSVEVAIAFLKEAGQKLAEVSSKGSNAIFDMLRNILHEGKLDKRVQYMIEVMFQVRKDGFQSFPSVIEELDLVEEEDQFTHLITFDDADDPQDILNVFKMDNDYTSNEEKYKSLRSEILNTDDDSDGDSGEGSDDDSDDDSEEGEEGDEKKVTIVDQTETNLVALRKTIYLTIQSSLDFEECAHKLLKMDVKPGQEKEMCHMFLDCCAEQRTYEKFFGLLAQRFCQVNQTYVEPFEQIFMDSYNTVHRLDTNKLRNVAKFFGHLLFTDAISWGVFSIIKLNEDDTTSSSRIFIKILFQELAEYMGLRPLNDRLKDPSLQEAMEGLLPRDNPKNTRFAINFFTSIGLGGLTDDLREHLKNLPKPTPIAQLVQEISSDSSSSSSESSDDSSESDSSSEESSDSSEEEVKKRKNKSKSKEATKSKSKADGKSQRNGRSKEPTPGNSSRSRSDRSRQNDRPDERQDSRRKEKTARSEDRNKRPESGREPNREKKDRHGDGRSSDKRRNDRGRRER
ncbi:MA3 [Nesidiocoris tenuis]|uniref:MA3 n=1 Tax=Nesidiocoris tenuis TaxID=355587 RepID=A0ABN7AMW6_9HEMI|nr:MA3 [Nesidiocoris tenuis]